MVAERAADGWAKAPAEAVIRRAGVAMRGWMSNPSEGPPPPSAPMPCHPARYTCVGSGWPRARVRHAQPCRRSSVRRSRAFGKRVWRGLACGGSCGGGCGECLAGCSSSSLMCFSTFSRLTFGSTWAKLKLCQKLLPGCRQESKRAGGPNQECIQRVSPDRHARTKYTPGTAERISGSGGAESVMKTSRHAQTTHKTTQGFRGRCFLGCVPV